jgi:hypothetical protein
VSLRLKTVAKKDDSAFFTQLECPSLSVTHLGTEAESINRGAASTDEEKEKSFFSA